MKKQSTEEHITSPSVVQEAVFAMHRFVRAYQGLLHKHGSITERQIDELIHAGDITTDDLKGLIRLDEKFQRAVNAFPSILQSERLSDAVVKVMARRARRAARRGCV